MEVFVIFSFFFKRAVEIGRFDSPVSQMINREIHRNQQICFLLFLRYANCIFVLRFKKKKEIYVKKVLRNRTNFQTLKFLVLYENRSIFGKNASVTT